MSILPHRCNCPNCGNRKPLIDPANLLHAATLRIRELEKALREDIAWINEIMCPECGVEMTPEHDEEAGGKDGYENEDCCKDAREHRSSLQATLASAASVPKAPPASPPDPSTEIR